MSEFVLAKKTDMVALADALRELSGGTEELAFPAEMIATIEAGGGNSKFVIGQFTPSSDIAGIELTHNLGVIPNFAFMAGDGDTNQSQFRMTLSLATKSVVYGYGTTNYQHNYYTTSTGTNSAESSDIQTAQFYNANTETIVLGGADGTSRRFKSGVTYTYVIGYSENAPSEF